MPNLKPQTKIARTLRKNQTPWEIKMWRLLRDRGLRHLKFRRQHRIDNYIVDFCCPEIKLVIELDGGQHNEKRNITEDKKRQTYLEKRGYKVLRFWNNEIDNNLEGVIQVILENTK